MAAGAPTRIAIAGGHGQIALHLTRLLTGSDEFEVYSIVRNPGHEPDIREAGGQPVRCDLEAEPTPQLIAALPQGLETMIFAAGSGPGSGIERKRSMDRDGAVKLIEAAEQLSIPRFLMISSMGADPDHEGEEVFDAYLRAKGEADQALVDSKKLAHTIIRPGQLTDDGGSGRVNAASSTGRGEIPREDVAATIAACLTDERTLDRSFELIAGETPIAEAIAAL